MKKIIFFVVIATLIQSGCNETTDLIQTTFKRTFDKNIISSYLSSNEKAKIKAALLSISHSEDTSFIPLITAVPFDEYPHFICFAIGQLGPCFSSTNYLWNKIMSDEMAYHSRFIFEALGKTGNEDDLSRLCEMFANYDGPAFPYSGISLAVRQFTLRGITSDLGRQILITESSNPFTSVQNRNDALFTLARTGSSDQIINDLKRNLLLPKTENLDTVRLKQYSLMNFRTLEFFLYDEDLLKNILAESNVLLKIEIARSLCHRKIISVQDADAYLNFIKDENPNVSRAAANGLQNLKTDSDEMKDYLKIRVGKLLQENLERNTLGELLNSYAELYDFYPSMLDKKLEIENRIPSTYWYNYLGKFSGDAEVLSLLINDYNDEKSLNKRMYIISNLLNFQEQFQSNNGLSELLITALESNSSPIVAITANSLDSIIILKEKGRLTELINSKIKLEKDNPDFAEATISLLELAEKIDSNLYSETCKLVLQSNVYSIRKYVAEKKKLEVTIEKPVEQLADILEKSFEYATAEIQTSKGNFVIEFMPEYAPVSVGNFCKLAEENYFDNVTFHRVVPGFVIQTGDKTGTGWGGPGYEIISEASPLNYEVGMVGMASAGKDTEGSQWFVMQGNYPHLNGRYSLFAKVLSGIEIVYKIDQDDNILDIKLYH